MGTMLIAYGILGTQFWRNPYEDLNPYSNAKPQQMVLVESVAVAVNGRIS